MFVCVADDTITFVDRKLLLPASVSKIEAGSVAADLFLSSGGTNSLARHSCKICSGQAAVSGRGCCHWDECTHELLALRFRSAIRDVAFVTSRPVVLRRIDP